MYYSDNSIVFYNGDFVNARDSKVSGYSQTLHYGNGVFEGMRAYKTLNGPKNTDIEIDISSHIKHIKSDTVNVIFGLEDWSIEGATTAAIEIKDGSCEQTVKLVKGLALNSDTDKECLMSGYSSSILYRYLS